MEFVRIKEDIFRLDMITRIREGRHEETFYGRSVRKGTEAWLDIYFVGGEVVKLEGEAATLLRRFLEQSCNIKDLSGGPADGRVPAPHTAPPAAPQPQPQVQGPVSMPLRGRGPHA